MNCCMNAKVYFKFCECPSVSAFSNYPVAISCLPGKLAYSPGTTPIANGIVQLLMLLKLLQKNYRLLKSCLQQLYLNKIITQLLHLVFVFTPAANLVKDEFSCQSDEFKSQSDEFNSQRDEFICQRDEVNCQKDEFNCQNL